MTAPSPLPAPAQGSMTVRRDAGLYGYERALRRHGPRAVAEIEWLAEHEGIRGIMIPTMWHDRTPYNDPSYEPIWSTAAANASIRCRCPSQSPRGSGRSCPSITSPSQSGR